MLDQSSMLRINKMTDYAVTLLCTMAQQPKVQFSAQQLTEMSNIALPAVSQILKKMCQNQIVISSRGPRGGYMLQHNPEQISLAQVIGIMEGPMSMTECSLGTCQCNLEDNCQFKHSWLKLSRIINHLLSNVTLIDMNQGLHNFKDNICLINGLIKHESEKRVLNYE